MSTGAPTTLTQALTEIKQLNSQLSEAKDAFDTILVSHEAQTERRVQLIRDQKTEDIHEEYEELLRRFRLMRKAISIETESIYHERKEWEKERHYLKNTITNLVNNFKRQIQDHERECEGRKRENEEWRSRTVKEYPDVCRVIVEDECVRLEVKEKNLQSELKMQKDVIKALHKEILKGKEELTYHTNRHVRYQETIQDLQTKLFESERIRTRERDYFENRCSDAEHFSAIWRELNDGSSASSLFDKIKNLFLNQTIQIRDAYISDSILQQKLDKTEKEKYSLQRRFLQTENELDRVYFHEIRARLREPEYEARIETLTRWAEVRDAQIERLENVIRKERDESGFGPGDATITANKEIYEANSQNVVLREENLSLREENDSLSWRIEQYEAQFEEKPRESWRKSSTPAATLTECLTSDDEQLVRVARQANVKGVEECSLFPDVGKVGEPIVCEAFSALRRIWPEMYMDAGRKGEIWMAVPKVEGYTFKEVREEKEMEKEVTLGKGGWPKPLPRSPKAELKPVRDDFDIGNSSCKWGTEWGVDFSAPIIDQMEAEKTSTIDPDTFIEEGLDRSISKLESKPEMETEGREYLFKATNISF